MLTQRMVEIFKSIVDEFVLTAEPIGSQTLVDKYRLPYSSATIRNDMASLEAMGFLEKPHTSAGRIPSNKGYQYYCEHLISKDADEQVKQALITIFDKPHMNIEEAIKQSCHVISEMTNLATGILGPDSKKQRLKHISAFPLDSKTIVCVFITNTGHTENKTFKFEHEVTSDDIKSCIDLLNDRLKDTPICELVQRLTSLKPILNQSIKRYEMLFNAFLGAFSKFATDTIYFQGTSKIMYQPEYADIERLRKLIKLFDTPDALYDFQNQIGSNTTALSKNKTQIVWKDNMAVISSKIKFSKDEDNQGQLMVVGPSRMNYDKVINLLDFIVDEIEKIYK